MHTHDNPAVARRFWAKVAVAGPDDCWLWTASTRKGRGQFSLGGRKGAIVEAPRVALFLVYGEMPAHLYALHTCDNGRCVNPAHLYWGTQKQNMADAVARRRMPYGDRHWLRRADAEKRAAESDRLHLAHGYKVRRSP
jgi:HNH endonuclease